MHAIRLMNENFEINIAIRIRKSKQIIIQALLFFYNLKVM